MQLVRARDPEQMAGVAACEPGFFEQLAARGVAQRFAGPRLAAGQCPAGMQPGDQQDAVAASAEELNRRKAEAEGITSAAAISPSSLPAYAPPNLWPRSPRGLFVGGSVIMSALGAHTICMEVFEMLKRPVRFTSAFVLAQAYVWTLVAPQALAANVAFSGEIAGVDTVYGE